MNQNSQLSQVEDVSFEIVYILENLLYVWTKESKILSYLY